MNGMTYVHHADYRYILKCTLKKREYDKTMHVSSEINFT